MARSTVREHPSLEEIGLKVTTGEVEVGRTYPIFGFISGLEQAEPGTAVARINYNISARMRVSDSGTVEALKQKAFETGIFICKITSKDEGIKADCEAVIFGRNPAFEA